MRSGLVLRPTAQPWSLGPQRTVISPGGVCQNPRGKALPGVGVFPSESTNSNLFDPVDQNQPAWVPPEEAVRLAVENGFSTAEIVRIASGALSHREALRVAKEYAPILGITVTEFMELRRNR